MKKAKSVKLGKRAKVVKKAEGSRLKAEVRRGKPSFAKASEGDPASAGSGGVRASKSRSNPLAGRVWSLEVDRERVRASATNPRKHFDEEGLRSLGENMRAVGQAQACLVRVDPVWATKMLGRIVNHRGTEGTEKNRNGGLWPVMRLGLEALAGQAMIGHSVDELSKAVWELVTHPECEFELIAGERRWRASAPKYGAAMKLRVDVRCLSDEEAISVQWVENLQREDLSVLEEAEGMVALKEAGWTPEKLAERFQKKLSWVYDRLKLAGLKGGARVALAEGRISATVARLVASIPDAKAQEEAVSKQGGLCFDYNGAARGVREVQGMIENHLLRKIDWALEQVFEHKGAVSDRCKVCPKMTRNMAETNPELAKGPARCFGGVACHEVRLKVARTKEEDARRAELEKVAKDEGLEVVKAGVMQQADWSDGDGEFLLEGREYDGWDAQKKKMVGWTVVLLMKRQGIKVAPFGVGRSHGADGSVARVWRRKDLVERGVVVPAAQEPEEVKRARMEQEEKEELAAMKPADREAELKRRAEEEKAHAERELVSRAREAALDEAFVRARGNEAGVLRMVLECREAWRGPVVIGGKEVEEFEGLSVEELREGVARSMAPSSGWWDAEKPPGWVKALGVDLEGALGRMRGELNAKGAKGAKKEDK